MRTEERKAQQRVYHAANREKRNAQSRARRAANPEEYNAASKAWYLENTERARIRSRNFYDKFPEKVLLRNARQRARKKGLEFTLTESDIHIPSVCPVLGIPLLRAIGTPCDGSITLDRIDNSKGYTPSNVIVVSYKANTIKSNATVAELQMVTDFYRRLISDVT